MNERERERTAAGLGTVRRRWVGGGGGRGEGACLLTLARVLKERWGRGGGGREGDLSPYFNSCLIRVLAVKHLPCSSPTPIHITPVLLHP